MRKLNIAVFASGNGSNFQAIFDAIKRKKVKADLRLLVCDSPEAYVLERAGKAKVKTLLIKRKDYESKKEFEAEIIKNLRSENIDLIALAGFMRMLSPWFVAQYKNKIINIHPSILPAFKGSQAIADAYEYGVEVTGVTVHFVNEEMDAGPIIIQEQVKIAPYDTLSSLENKIHTVEHRIYPRAIQLFVSGRLRIRGRRVVVSR